jgi:tetratricopeptide (TPR) repeat protein
MSRNDVSSQNLHYTGFDVLRGPLIAVLFAICLIANPLVHSQPTADVKPRLEKAEALKSDGNYEEARKIYESLLPGLRARGASSELSEVLNNLSAFANDDGHYEQAVALAAESVQVCQSLHDQRCEAKSRNDLGQAYSNGSRYGEAATELEQSLRLSNEIGDAETKVLVLNNLGNVFYYQAKYSEAFRTYEDGLREAENSKALWAPPWQKISRLNLATLYQRLGNDQRAIATYYDVLNAPRWLSPREIAHVLANVGILYRRLNDPEAALKNYRDAEKYYAQQKDADGEIGVLKNIGIVFALDLGRYTEALKTFDQAHSLAEKTGNQREMMQTLLYRAETLYRMDRLADAGRDFEGARAVATRLGTTEEEWKALYGLGKIDLRNGHIDAAEQRFRSAIERIENLRSKLQLNRLRSDFLADKRDVYDALIKLLLDRNDLPAVIEYMERSRARSFQDRFFTGKMTPGSLTLNSIQSRLSEQTALIEFWVGQDAIAAVWITRNSAGIAKKQFSHEEMGRLVQLVSGLPENLPSVWRTSFGTITSSLPAGIAPFGSSEFVHLLVIPDGFLSLLPIELLQDGSGALLLQHHDITYLPSAVLLLRDAVSKKRAIRFPWERELVGFGDPRIVTAGESSVLASTGDAGNFSALPSSGEEIRTIAGMSSGRTLLYLSAADRKAAFFMSARSGASLLHVSTHAVADMDNPERSRLLFSPDEIGGPNNFLFLKELYDVDLRGVALTTLSACDTERGRLIPGEGVQAFSRALLAAGSRSALTTLWRVPDQPTSDFMKHFYFYLLKEHKTKAEALRLSKLDFIASGTELSHPQFWAAFVLNGNGTEPVPIFLSWWNLFVAFSLIAASAAILAWRSRRASKRKSDLNKVLHART